MVSTASGAGPVHTAELTLGKSANPSAGVGTSAALSANGKVALLGTLRRLIGGHVDPSAEVYTSNSGKWTGPVELSLGKLPPGSGGSSSYPVSVALSADGTTALVGDSYFGVTGAVIVFTFSHGAWRRSATLTLGVSAAEGGSIGSSVALSADGHTALLGAPNLQVAATRGAGEIFTFGKGRWQGPTELPFPRGHLGRSVALSANGHVALLGAPCLTVVGRNCTGAGEVFTLKGTKWSVTAELPGNTIHRGVSVALSGSGATALIGGDLSQSALVYTYSSGAWSRATALFATGEGYFGGVTTALSLNSRGTVALVGSPSTQFAGKSNGGVTDLYTLIAGKWTHAAEMTLGNAATAQDGFGWSTALSSSGSAAVIGVPNRKVGGVPYAGAGEAWSLPG
ncbi:MAG TPA: hypothetical protein VG815_00185 [Chloroflexota bacterium]|jgi:hypothetical protein|nr:hypothetical protein [Chloroflexota bacterium]